MEYILNLIQQIGPFFLLLGLLIFFHELGHFSVARFFGVRVETFSIGFGKALLKYKYGDTEYRISIIPFGGYVKMFGDNPTAKVPEEEKKYAFIHQPVWPRIAIVLAGPLANLILAFLIFFVIGLTGETQIASVLGDIKPNTVAYDGGLRSGDKVVKLNDKNIKSFEQLEAFISEHPNESINLSVVRNQETHDFNFTPTLAENPNILSSKKEIAQIEGLTAISTASTVGFTKDSIWHKAGLLPLDQITKINDTKIETFRDLKALLPTFEDGQILKVSAERYDVKTEKATAVNVDVTYDSKNAQLESTELYLGQVQSGSPGEKAGLKRGDRITHINDKEILVWEDLLNIVKGYQESDGPLKLTLLSNFETKTAEVTPLMQGIMNSKGQEEKRPIIGILSASYLHVPDKVMVSAGGLFASIGYAYKQTIKWTVWTFNSVKKVIIGEVSSKNLGGMFTIGQVASQSLKVGWTYFLQMMGIISINLFLLNLIPIPVLDGGHLLFFGIEAVRGRPVSPQKMELAFLFGFVILVSLMSFTLFNDVQRIFLSGW